MAEIGLLRGRGLRRVRIRIWGGNVDVRANTSKSGASIIAYGSSAFRVTCGLFTPAVQIIRYERGKKTRLKTTLRPASSSLLPNCPISEGLINKYIANTSYTTEMFRR